MSSSIKSKSSTTAMQYNSPEERLIVKDREHLHLLGRFYQALFLNFLKKPGKVKIIEKTDLIVAFDPVGYSENGLSVTFKRGLVILECGIRPDAEIIIKAAPALLGALARMPAGPSVIKYLMSYEGKDFRAQKRSGEFKIKGALRHPLKMMKFGKIMAPNIN